LASYIETHYTKNEYSESAYPQKLCDYIFERYIKTHFKFIEEDRSRTILDVGSGKGNHLVAFARRGLNVFGLDKIDDHPRELEQFDIQECDLECEKFPFDDESFDVVFSKSVSEHVANSDNFLSEIKRVLRPGGLVIILCPDWGTKALMYWDDYTHVKPWTRKGLQNAMHIHGFQRINCVLFRQIPLLWKWPLLELLSDLIAFCPESWKWKDKNESIHREWIRFSKEKMLLATASKST